MSLKRCKKKFSRGKNVSNKNSSNKNSSNKRKVFYFQFTNGQRRSVLSIGVIFYIIDKNKKIKWLVRNNQGVCEDIAGNVNFSDFSILDSIIRVTMQRTNSSLFGQKYSKKNYKEKFKRLIFEYNKNNIKRRYIGPYKHLVHFIKLPAYFFHFDINKFSHYSSPFIWTNSLKYICFHPRIQELQDLNEKIIDIVKNNNKKSKKKYTKKVPNDEHISISVIRSLDLDLV